MRKIYAPIIRYTEIPKLFVHVVHTLSMELMETVASFHGWRL